MGKVDRALGEEIRRRRTAGADTLESLGSKLGVSEKTIGKWERGVAMPSATNLRLLGKFGLIEEWLRRNGANGQHSKGARQEADDRIARTSPHPGSERRALGKGSGDACERELMTVFRAFAVDEQSTIVEVLRLILAKLEPGN